MKYLMAAIGAILLASCSTPARVTPMADVRPVRQSNEETRKAIKSTKTKIQESKEHNEKGASSLQEAISALDRLLNE